MPGKVTICTVHRDTPEWLEASFRRLSAHTSPCPRVLVVDNGSGAEAAEEIASLCRLNRAESVRLPEPVPHGAALDAAIAKVATPWVLALDSDAFPVRDGWLDAMLAEVGPNTVAVGASAGMAHAENPFGNYAHPSMCLVSVDFLRWSGAAFRDAWPRWDTGEQVTIEAMRLGRDVRYLPTTVFGLFGHGVLVAGSVFHAYYGTRLKSAPKEAAQTDGIDARALRAEHRRLLDAEAAHARGGPDPFGGNRSPGVDMSVIVPFRRRRGREDRNLLATVESLNAQTLERNRYEIVIVEADQLPSLDPPPGCRVVFAYCPEPLFRKSWAMNVGSRQSSGGILVFHDADVLAPPEMLESIAAKIGGGSQVVKPSFSVFDLTREATDTVYSGGIAALRRVPAEGRKLRSAPGGSIAVARERFSSVHGYNERFAGWGGEDDEFLLRLRAQGCDPPDLGCRLHHLWHECGPLDHGQVAANRRLVEHVRRLGRQAAVRYIGAMPEGYGDANAFRRAAARRGTASPVVALLAGAYSGYGPDANAGDDATRDVLVSLLKRKGCSVRISPGHPCTEGHLAGADMVVVGGGGLVADHSEDAFYNYMSYLKHAAARRIPAAVLGVGVCRLGPKRCRISSLLRGAMSVCVRDELSRKHLEDGGFATVAADLAWLLKPGRPIMPLGRDTAGVFLVGDSYADNADYRDAVHQHVDGLAAQGLTPVLVLHAKDDRRAVPGFTRRYPSAKLLDYFGSKGNTPSGVIATLSRMSQVATSRYHGIIFSVLAGTPCRVIQKSPEKVSFLCREIGAERLADKSRAEEIAAEMRKRARGNVRNLSGLVAKARLARSARERGGPAGGMVVSVCMITLNEAPHIRKALASIPPSSQIGEILVVDGGSTDETVSIIKADGRAKLLHRPFAHDFSDQKNFCISQAAYDWVVWLDADETFPPDFWASIDRLTASGHDAFLFPRENFIGGGPSPANNLENEPDFQFRLFSRKCRWTGRVHENLTGYAGAPGKADFVICHRKGRRRQDWNDAYYAWIRGVGDRPSPELRAGA